MASLVELFPRELSEHAANWFLIGDVTLQAIGLAGCVAMLATVLISKSLHRHAIWLSFAITWIVSPLSYLLLAITGNMRNLHPPFGLCLAQAAFIYSAPLITGFSVLGLVAQVYFNVRRLFSDGLRRHEKHLTVFLVVAPYVVHATMTIACLIVGFKNPHTVRRRNLQTPYCDFVIRVPSRIVSVSVVLLAIPALTLEVLVLIMIRKNWTFLKARRYSPSVAIRVMGFSVFGILVVGMGVLFASSKTRNPALDLLLSLLPVAAYLHFGTQRDIVNVWMFWKREKPFQSAGVDSRTRLKKQRDPRFPAPSYTGKSYSQPSSNFPTSTLDSKFPATTVGSGFPETTVGSDFPETTVGSQHQTTTRDDKWVDIRKHRESDINLQDRFPVSVTESQWEHKYSIYILDPESQEKLPVSIDLQCDDDIPPEVPPKP